MSIDRDRLSTLDPRHVARAAVLLVDAVSDEAPEVQVQAIALLQMLVCEEHGLEVRDELVRAARIMRTADGDLKPEVRALRAYIQGEIS